MRSDSSNGCSPGTPIQEQEGHRLPDLLRHARESRGLTLEQLANETKIPVSRLATFEHPELLANDIGFYLRAQIRAYARALNVDENVVLAELNREPAPLPPPEVQVQEPEPRMPALRVPRAPVAAGLVIAAILAGRLMATLDIWPAADPGLRPASSSVPALETPVPTSAAAADLPTAESGRAVGVAEQTRAAAQADRITPAAAFENSSGLELQALRTADASEPGGTAVPTAPADTPTPARSVTELVVTSEPAGARVTVNGIGWGATPITIRHLPAGPKRVRVTLEGFAAAEQVVSVGPDRPRSLDVRLSPVGQ